jgi:hypothetical protein
MTADQLTAILAERVMGWRVGPDRFLTGNRRWMPRWRYRPLDHLPDAIRLLEGAEPAQYTITDTNWQVSVCVQIAGITGEARDRSKPRAVALAIARAPQVQVDSLESPNCAGGPTGKAERR